MRALDQIYEHFVPTSGDYQALLGKIHEHLLPRTYVEVGVSRGQTMTLALPGTRCIGVDPNPRIAYHLARGTRLFTETSDDFFAAHSVHDLFAGTPLDLAFIDGLHLFEFALRDFINLEKASNPSTTILIHDCLPVDEASASRGRNTQLWSGDIWRLILALKERRPDLSVVVIDCAPTGVGLVRGLDPNSTVLADHYDEIFGHYLSIPYETLEEGPKEQLLNCVADDWDTVRSLLPDRPFRRANVEWLKLARTVEAARFNRRRRRQLTRTDSTF